MGKILLLSLSVPPELTGSAVVVGNLAQQFHRDEMVLAGERPAGRDAVAWRDEWPRIEYVSRSWPAERRGLRWYRLVQFPLLLWRLNRLAQRERCDTLVAVFPSTQYLLAGYLVARWRRMRLFPYFHNTYFEARRGWAQRFAAWLQGRVFASAEHVFVMSAGMRRLYAQHYPRLSCSALVHSFNDEPPTAIAPPELRNPLRLVMFGNINQSCADAAARLAEAVRQRPDWQLQIYSGMPRKHLEALGLRGDNIQIDTAPPGELVPRIQEADLVLLPHGFEGGSSTIEYQTIFPTKTLEALLSGRPIVAHVLPQSFLNDWLREHDCAEIVDVAEVAALHAAIDRLRADPARRQKLVANAVAASGQFHAPRVVGELRARILPGDDGKPGQAGEKTG